MDDLDAVLERIINRKRNRPKLNKVWRAYDPSPCEQGRCFSAPAVAMAVMTILVQVRGKCLVTIFNFAHVVGKR